MSVSETSSRYRIKLGLAAIGVFAIGGAAGGMVGHHMHPAIAMAPSHPIAIRDLASAQGIVTVKGRVAEAYGNRIVIDDGTGRTLVDGGPHGGEQIASPGSVVMVQGQYDHDSFHPDYLVDASGIVRPLGHPHGPHHHPGPDGDDGPRPDHDAPPPPPAPVAPKAG